MNHVPIRLGPLALLLAVVSICLAVLSVLTFSTARADLALAQHHAQTVQLRYELEQQAQQFVATAAPGSAQTFEQDGMTLTVALDKNGHVMTWLVTRAWEPEETIGGLWSGN